MSIPSELQVKESSLRRRPQPIAGQGRRERHGRTQGQLRGARVQG